MLINEEIRDTYFEVIGRDGVVHDVHMREVLLVHRSPRGETETASVKDRSITMSGRYALSKLDDVTFSCGELGKTFKFHRSVT
jgi:hypothetical protein